MNCKNILLSAIILSLCACSDKKDSLPKNVKPPAIVDAMIAQPTTITQTIEANGAVVAFEYAELHPEISGRVTYLNIPEGTKIEKGTVIARINDADLEAQMNKTKVLLDLAIKTEQRLKKLLAVNGINQADYDAALNTVNSYKADLVYTQSLIDKTVVKAPFSGVLGLRLISPGAYVTPQTLIATIQEVDKLKIDFTVPQEYAHLIKKGHSVAITTDALEAKKAVIIATEPQINSTTRNLKVRALLENTSINPGAFVKVTIASSANNHAFVVPTNAIIPEDKNSQLVLVKNNKAVFVNVEKGIREENSVEITKGLKAGDTIVVTGVLFVRPKSDVKVRSIKPIENFLIP